MPKFQRYTANSSKFLLSLVGLFILTIGVLAGVILTQNTNNSQDTRSQAASGAGIGEQCWKDSDCQKTSNLDIRCINWSGPNSYCDDIGGHLTCPAGTISNQSCESCTCKVPNTTNPEICSTYLTEEGKRRCNRPAYDNVPYCCTPLAPSCILTNNWNKPSYLTNSFKIVSKTTDGTSVRVNWTPGVKSTSQLFRMGTSLDEVNAGCPGNAGREPCIASYTYPAYITPAQWTDPQKMYYFSIGANSCTNSSGVGFQTSSLYTDVPTCNANLSQYVGDATGICYKTLDECTRYNKTSQDVSGLIPGKWYYARVVNFNSGTCYADEVKNYNVPGLGGIGDKVWIDTNKNGVQDEGEPGKADVRVFLTSSTGVQVATTTNSDGIYLFTGLKNGDYSLSFTLPTGYQFTTANVGSDFYDSDADARGATGNINIGAGDHWPQWDAGLVAITIIPTNTPPIRPSITPTRTPTLTPTKTPTRTPTPGVVVCNNKLDISLIIDRSSSMNAKETDGRTKLVWAKEATVTFMNILKVHPNNRNNVRVSVDSFGAQGNANDSTYGNLKLASEYKSTLNISLTNIYNNVITSLNNLKYIKSGTCIQCGLVIANKQLTNTANKRVAILLSDGRANHTWTGTTSWINGVSNVQAAVNAANTGRSRGITYKAIGYGKPGSINETALKAIAGGTANYQYKPNARDWSTAFLNILRQLCP